MVFEKCECYPNVKEGYYYIEWVGQFIGNCTWTPVEVVSLVFGLSNIVLWLFATFPQFYENWKRKSVEAVHPLFLIIWLLGDTTNLLGSVLTQQLPFQIYTASYFCIVDFFLVSQWVYYTKIYKPYVEDETPVKKHSFTALGIILVINVGVVGLFIIGNSYSADINLSKHSTLRELLSVDGTTGLPSCQFSSILEPWVVTVGDISAWTSCVLYNAARVPQIVRNFQRKTVSGLSIEMFLIICVANMFYGTSVLLLQPPVNPRFYASVLPFLLGSLGPLVPSAVVIGQWIFYDNSNVSAHLQLHDDEEEFTHIK